MWESVGNSVPVTVLYNLTFFSQGQSLVFRKRKLSKYRVNDLKERPIFSGLRVAGHPRTDQSCIPTHLAEIKHLKNFVTPGSAFEITFKTKGIFGFHRAVFFEFY